MIAIAPWFKLARGLRQRPLPRRTAVLLARSIAVVGYGREIGFALMRELTQEKSVWVNVR
jgi:hypothetical protein